MEDIIFVHKGWSDYLYYTVRQARETNPHARVHLLGDKMNYCLRHLARHENYRNYFEGADEFERYYQHLNTVDYHYVLFWFQKIFVLKNYLLQKNIPRAYYADSDNMIFCDIASAAKKFTGCDVTLSMDHPYKAGSMHTMFCYSVGALEKFCAFALQAYRDKSSATFKEMIEYFFEKLNENVPGGVSEMFLFWLMNREGLIQTRDTTTIVDGSTHDHAMAMSRNGDHELEMKNGIKRIYWQNRQPYGRLIKTGKLIKFDSLHFQDITKKFIKGCYFRQTRTPALLVWWDKLIRVDFRKFLFAIGLLSGDDRRLPAQTSFRAVRRDMPVCSMTARTMP